MAMMLENIIIKAKEWLDPVIFTLYQCPKPLTIFYKLQIKKAAFIISMTKKLKTRALKVYFKNE